MNNRNEELGKALLEAVKNRQHKAASDLLNAGAVTTCVMGSSKNGVLHLAVLNNDVKMISLLLKHGADRTSQNKEKQTTIHLAGNLEYWKCVSVIASDVWYDDKGYGQYGAALLEVAQHRQHAVAEKLLSRGAYTTWHDSRTKNTALHYAVLKNDPAMGALLAKFNADITVKNKSGKTPVDLAADNMYWNCVAAFANPNKYYDSENAIAYRYLLASILIHDVIENNIFRTLPLDVIQLVFNHLLPHVDVITSKQNIRLNSVKLFVKEYEHFGIFPLRIGQSKESVQFVDELKNTLNANEKKEISLELVGKQIDSFAKLKEQQPTRAITLLQKYHLLSDKRSEVSEALPLKNISLYARRNE